MIYGADEHFLYISTFFAFFIVCKIVQRNFKNENNYYHKCSVNDESDNNGG
jgi:hypothetical protein